MSTFLFDKIVFGPVHSRRLGLSLGINLLPTEKKYCNFNCIYCECGWSGLKKVSAADMPSRVQIASTLESKLLEMQNENRLPDVITFAGNGEPTMHPDFAEIIDDSLDIRDRLSPGSKIAVLTNSTLISHKKIANALERVDQCILKLDSVVPETFRLLNCPVPGVNPEIILQELILFPGNKIIQTLFLRGIFANEPVNNTSSDELEGLINAYRLIQPEYVMIYTFERETPATGLEKISGPELDAIGEKIKKSGIMVMVTRE